MTILGQAVIAILLYTGAGFLFSVDGYIPGTFIGLLGLWATINVIRMVKE